MEKNTFSEKIASLVLAAYALFGSALSAVGIVPNRANRGGGGGGSGPMNKAITIVVLVLLIAYTFPSALTAIFTANTSGFTTAAQGLWPVLGLIAEIAALVVIVRSAL